jgi:hypothetical protein
LALCVGAGTTWRVPAPLGWNSMIFTSTELALYKTTESIPFGGNVLISSKKLPVPSVAHIEQGGILGLFKQGDFPLPVEDQVENDFPIVLWQREINASNKQFWLFVPVAEMDRKAVKLYMAAWQMFGGVVYPVSDLEEDLQDIETSLPSFSIRTDILSAMPGINEKIARLLIEKWKEYDSTGRNYCFNEVIWSLISNAAYGNLEQDIMAIVDANRPEREKWLQQLFLDKKGI